VALKGGIVEPVGECEEDTGYPDFATRWTEEAKAMAKQARCCEVKERTEASSCGCLAGLV